MPGLLRHAASALPLLLLGHPVAAACALAPDLALLPSEAARRRAGRSVDDWARSPGRWGEAAYRASHSAIVPLALAALGLRSAALGWAVHLALDSASRHAGLGWTPLWPATRWRWPLCLTRGTPRSALLLSGGADSAACACLDLSSRLVFVDLGQPDLAAERVAASYVASTTGRELEVVRLAGLSPPEDPAGTVPGRNRALVAAAANATGAEEVVVGSRCLSSAFDRHGDCSPSWARRTGVELGVRITSPVRGWPKAAVWALVALSGLEPRRLAPTKEKRR